MATTENTDVPPTKKKLEVLRKKELRSTLGPDIKKTLHHLKIRFGQVKLSVKEEQLKFFLLESVAGEEIHRDADAAANQDNSARTARTLSDLKEDLENVKDNVEEMAQDIQQLYEEYQLTLSEVETLQQEIQSKKQKVTDLYGSDFKQVLKDVQNKYEPSAEEAELLCTAQQRRYLVEDSQHDISELQHHLNEMRTINSHYLSDQVNRMKNIKQLKIWCEGLIQVLQSLHGVSDEGISGYVWSVAIAPPAQSSRSPLKVSLTMKWGSQPTLIDMQVDSSDINTADILEDTLNTNDICGLIQKLHTLWTTQYTLLDEIHSLRSKYAIDWLRETGTLQVMFGMVLCQLRVQPGYPDTGDVELVKVTGRDIDPEDMQPSQKHPSLTQWLDFLNEVMTSAPSVYQNSVL